MIRAVNMKGANRARAICDVCKHEELVTADVDRKRGGAKATEAQVNEGQVKKKIVAHGWSEVKGTLRCPSCEKARKAAGDAAKGGGEEVKDTDNVTDLRRPSPAQKRQIVELLMVSYDVEAGCYKGSDTDRTVAGAIGDGVMPGWVAEIREDMFGPDGGNAEMETLLAEIAQWRETAEAARSEVRDKLATFDDAVQEVDRLAKRVEAIKKAVGPKARSA